jgi:hypothetical protein
LGVSIDGSTITVQDYPINVSISKVNSSGTPLAGAVLRITDTAGNIVVPQWTSEITPKVIKDNDLLIAGQKYILEEMSAPSGYDKASPVTFTIENTAKAAEGVMRTDVVMVDPTTPSPFHTFQPVQSGRTADSAGRTEEAGAADYTDRADHPDGTGYAALLRCESQRSAAGLPGRSI